MLFDKARRAFQLYVERPFPKTSTCSFGSPPVGAWFGTQPFGMISLFTSFNQRTADLLGAARQLPQTL